MRTPWGYDVGEELPPLLSVAEFNTMTGGAYATNPRVEGALKAASQAIRNYCGWHICPSMSCIAEPKGGGNVKRLPAGYVSAISRVTDGGEELDEQAYEWREDGLLRRNHWSKKWGGVLVEYTAGYETSAVPDLAEAVASITSGVLSVAAGVTSESADGVSISYSANASSIASALTTQMRTAFGAYKVVSSHAS